MPFNHQEIEQKWRKFWEENKTFQTENLSQKPKKYILDMFPYPSGAGLHVGHPKGYTATDIVSRFYHASGYNVLHPMGFDAFGLPAENYAIKTGTHPSITTAHNIATFTEQLKLLGFSYDWDRMVDTTDPKYYQWTQWIFLELFKKWLAYEQDLPINYCPHDKTGLANEEVIDGCCERCGTRVERRAIRQWVLKITDYADKLIADLDGLDWPEGIKEMQRNWIGKSEGCEFEMKKSDDASKAISVYTTRIDTVFGMTYAVLAPDHPQVWDFITPEQKSFCEAYIAESKSKSDQERTNEGKDKTGVFTGSYVINPYNGEYVPLWIADYVLGSYGTGAVMAVPAHDERDFEFAYQYNLNFRHVITIWAPWSFEGSYIISSDMSLIEKLKEEDGINIYRSEELYDTIKDSVVIGWKVENLVSVKKKYNIKEKIKLHTEMTWVLIESTDFTGEQPLNAQKKLKEKAEKEGFGKKKINYKLRDWLFSRQRYWGEPIPVIHIDHEDYAKLPRELQSSGASIVSREAKEFLYIDGKEYSQVFDGLYTKIVLDPSLPLTLPEVEKYEPAGDGQSPLATVPEWVNVTLADNLAGKRETNTMPQWWGSCWYYLRYMDPKNPTALASREALEYWGMVDEYVGWAEHAVLHLLYARFWHKVLYELGVVPTKEPFQKLTNVGLILGPDGQKMSKSRGNVINPNDVVSEYGADTLRLYEMSMGAFTDPAPWNTEAIVGVRRFLDRAYHTFLDGKNTAKDEMKAMKLLHKTIKKVGEDIREYKFNTAISALIILLNEGMPADAEFALEWKSAFARLLHPFAPHLAEELWSLLGNADSIYLASWPEYDEFMLIDDEVTIAIQINGKLRGTLTCMNGVMQEEVSTLAHENPEIAKWLEGKILVKEIFIPNKMLSIVVKDAE